MSAPYIIVTHEYTSSGLAAAVNAKLAEGYVPVGGVCATAKVGGASFYQAMALHGHSGGRRKTRRSTRRSRRS